MSMVIQNSVVGMASYSQSTTCSLRISESYTGWGDMLSLADQSVSTSPTATDSKQNFTVESANNIEEGSLRDVIGRSNPYIEELLYGGGTVEMDDEGKLEFGSLSDILKLISSNGSIKTKKITTYDLFRQLLSNFRERLRNILQDFGQSSGTNKIMVKSTETEVTKEIYYENEQMQYISAGKVQTADGREIDFEITAAMSRSFCEQTEMRISYEDYRFVDPLVISLSGDGADVRDQTFLFDIDMDGEQDNIAMLAQNCGFLALDKNGDGIINDGNELFGAKTGDGFGELAVFDMDGNGWIDENDEVFNHLRVWSKDSEGNDKLVALGVAGVGAIYLGNVNTNFSLNNSENHVAAQIGSTGIYLHEDGTAGLIQHLDMAVQEV